MTEQERHMPTEFGTTLIPIPANIWNEFVLTCQESEDITSKDYHMFASIICIDAISSYTNRKKKRNAKKKGQP